MSGGLRHRAPGLGAGGPGLPETATSETVTLETVASESEGREAEVPGCGPPVPGAVPGTASGTAPDTSVAAAPRPGPNRPGLRLRGLDPYVAALAGTVLLAALLPATGRTAHAAELACDLAVGLLFFLYGARLSARETLAGLRHLRLHGLVLACTFVLFPCSGSPAPH